MKTRLKPISQAELIALYRECVELGAVLADTDWSPPPTTAQELINRIRKEPKP